MTSFELSGATQQALIRTLSISRIEDVLDMEFRVPSEDFDVSREKAAVYSNLNRGSVRLNSGKFYTFGEFRERVARVKAMPLP